MNRMDKHGRFMEDSYLQEVHQVYSGQMIDVYENQLINDRKQRVHRELVHHPDAVAILAITDQDEVLMVKQYRYGISQDLYEIPAGMIDNHDDNSEETPLEAAQRELEEETGYRAEDWRDLGAFYPSPGFLDEKIHLYQATGLNKIPEPLPMDEDEWLEVYSISRDKVQSWIGDNKIEDMKTMMAILHWLSEGGSYEA